MLAYSARRIVAVPGTNVWLHLSVVFCVGLQLLTVLVPGLRLVLGLEQPRLFGLVWVGAAILLSFISAEIYAGLRGCRPEKREGRTISAKTLSLLKRIVVAVVGFTVLLFFLALLVLPGPAFIVIPLGLAILATEFVWARALLRKTGNALTKSIKRQQPSA